jgi:carboxyl-terminal processing protease
VKLRGTSTRSGGLRRVAVFLPLFTLAAGIALLGSSLTQGAYAAPQEEYRLSSLRVFNRVVLLVKEQYVEPQRIRPREMLIASLEAIEKRVPEVLVEEPVGDKLGVSVGKERREFMLEDLGSLWELSFKLRDVFRFMETRLSPEVDRREVEYAAVNGMLSKLDPHSVLLEPRFSKEMKLSTKGEFGGLGIVISIRDSFLTVISPIDGTPAEKAGVLAQDKIVKIGEESTVNMGLDEAVERLRGKPGTEIVIYVERKGLDEPKRVSLIRAIIKVDSVTHNLLQNKIGYVKLKQFQGRTAEDVADAVKKMRKEAGGQLKGLVLDLRNNPGGLLDQAVEVSDLFMRDGVLVVTQEGGSHGERREVRATRRPEKIDVPVVVLVNGGSASASEIVAGAIKNRGRGLVVGDQTFGKGSVQQLYDFPDSSSLKLTIGQYLTPGDESIQSVGITPDVLVRAVVAQDKESLNLLPDMHTREEDLEAHLDDVRIKLSKALHELTYLEEVLEEGEAERRATSSKFHDDFEIRFARDTLMLATGNDRPDILKAAERAVQISREREDKRIAAALEKLGLDWSKGPLNAKAPQVKVRAVDVVPGKAGEPLALTFEAENVGDVAAFQVHGNSLSTLGLLIDKEFLFGKLAPGEKRRWTTEVKIPKNFAARDDLLRVKVSDQRGADLGAVKLPIRIEGLPRPRFAYALFIDDGAGGNGDGMLQVGESVDLVVSIRNTGEGVAEQPTALLKNLGGAELFIETGRQQLKELGPGQAATARFSFKVKEPKAEADLRLQVFDGVMGDYLLERIRLPIRAAGAAAKPQKGFVTVGQNGAMVFAAAEGTAPVLARAAAGVKLSSVSEVGGFVRVSVGEGVVGYVAAADVDKAQGRADVVPKGEPKGLSVVYGRDPPRVTFLEPTKGGSVRVAGDSVQIRARVEDDGPVRDVYVFNGEQKVSYQLLAKKGPTDVTLEATVKLEPGVNMITVVAREDDEFAQREVLMVYSGKGDPLAKLKRVSRH